MHIPTIKGAAAAIVLASFASAQVNAPCFEGWYNNYIPLGDDAVASIQLGFTFPGPGGVNYTDIDVGSNGFLYLGTNPGHDPRCCDGDPLTFILGDPAIAAMWEDLDPSNQYYGGGIYFNSIPASPGFPARGVITWGYVAEMGGGPNITAQVQLLDTGEFVIYHDSYNTVARHNVLVGVTQGLGASPNPIAFPRIGGTVSTGANPTAYQVFNNATYNLPGLGIAGLSYEFIPNGSGGYTINERSICHYAGFTRFGQGCPALTGQTFYELFQAGTMDLSNSSIQFQPNGVGGWISLPGSGQYFNGFVNNLNLNDDDVAQGVALPFPFVHSNTVSNTIDVASNGFIWVDPTAQWNPRCCEGNPQQLFQDPGSICPMWMDLYPPGGGGVYADADPSGSAFYVTWDQVPEYYNGSPQTFQLALYPNGGFEFRYQTCMNQWHNMVVGASEGHSSLDPGSRDLSTAVPFDTGIGGSPLGLDATNYALPQLGSAFSLDVQAIPANTPVGFMLLSPHMVGTPLAAFGMPGCKGYVDFLGNCVTMVFPVSSSVVTVPLPIPANNGLTGTTLYAQAATMSTGFTPLGVIASNGAQIIIGN
jgi:hypothetical protein